MVSLIIPIYNEAGNIIPLYSKLDAVLTRLNLPYEIILIDDGSTDGSGAIFREIALKDKQVKFIQFFKNYGQTAAFMAGLDQAKGDIIIPMDSDLQNDPEDIPLLLNKLKEGYDLVSGWRKNRHDSFVRRLFSRIANRLVSLIWGLEINDLGCTLKAYHRECFTNLRLYGEVHRFLPLILKAQGALVAEIEVRHHRRHSGKSKYNLSRIFKVVLDLLTFAFMSRFFAKPNYVFGFFGLVCCLFAFITFSIVFYRVIILKLVASTPMIFLWLFFSISSLLFFLMGFLAEMITRLFYESESRRPYRIKNTVNCDMT